jgi:hypothetical protein
MPDLIRHLGLSFSGDIIFVAFTVKGGALHDSYIRCCALAEIGQVAGCVNDSLQDLQLSLYL